MSAKNKNELTLEDLYRKWEPGCSAREQTYRGWYCRGQFMKECKAENCFVAKFALEVLKENKDAKK